MVLSNLGAGEYWEGRWTEALDLYRRAREASERLGDPAVRAQNEMNIAEVLVDQGTPTEAEELLRRTSRVWRALGDDYLLGFCLTQLGRVAGLTARTQDAVETFERAREVYRATGAPGQIVEVDLREAEVRLLAGEPGWLLEREATIAAELAADGGVNVFQPLLDRLVGYAAIQTGDEQLGVEAFERSVASARDRGADHDLAVALQGLARVIRRRGGDPGEFERESGEICRRLGIVAVPAFPLTAADGG
jgi:tetratricopeptide (TPR) repeat protein